MELLRVDAAGAPQPGQVLAPLARWLAEPAEGPVLELDQLLKVFFAEHGTKRDLLATLAGVGEWAEQRADEDAEIARNYLVNGGQFPERTAQMVLVGRYPGDHAETRPALGVLGDRAGAAVAGGAGARPARQG